MDGRKFTSDLSSSGAAKLKECVKEKLSEYIGNHTDDVLVEYVVVLVGHGKEKSHAVKDLEAFLGGGSESFVDWLWNHMSVNKESYCKIEDSRPSESVLADEGTQMQQGEPNLRSVVAVVEHDEKPTTRMEVEEQSEGLQVTRSVKPDDLNTDAEADNSSGRRSRRRDGPSRNRVKRPRSPEIWTRRGRGRGGRPDVKEMSPPVVIASRRLLINAVREVFNESALLATKKDSSKKTESAKRLQSVVSSDADVQGNGGTEVDMIHEHPAVELEPFAVEDRHFDRIFQLLQSQKQDKPVSVWDRIKLYDRSAQKNMTSFAAEGQFSNDGAHYENKGKWKKNGAAGRRAGSAKARDSREQRYRAAPYSGRTVDVTRYILEDTLRSVSAEHMENQDILLKRNRFNSHKLGGQRSGNGFSQSNGKVVRDEQLTVVNEDVLELKKRLRQVQLDMTKLRARQAEVTKEVQSSPAAGASPIPFEPEPSQEDINDRSVFVTNVHFASTQAALRVHFGGCGYVNRVTLLVDSATGMPKGSAFVEFTTKDAVENALALNESSLLSRNLKVMRKNSAIAEMNPVPPFSNSFVPPPFPRGYSREHVLPHKLYPVRRPIGPPLPYTRASNLKWKRDASGVAATGTPGGDSTSTEMEMIITSPVRSSRSLSYVRVAPCAIQDTADGAQKT